MLEMINEPIPEVDMRIVARNAEVQRRGILGFAPRIGLSIVDYDDLDRIDSFYLQSQKFRDYYRDPHNRLHKPPRFQRHQGKCGIKLDHSVGHLTQPIRWVEEQRPLVYPLSKDTATRLGMPISPMIRGRHDKSSSLSYLH
ncbi:uncharacterized protein LOC108044983 [Drosophila rhopaloa]|uniref:Uncharacterized protein LOC108044983 n=1 Tax=Drosophila rhopaloa TaxID=1041015 RepID=A0A6P4F2S5_DRORH|nr:uncharacterized protein LOC108044983 [Drosophila rhopaloa]